MHRPVTSTSVATNGADAVAGSKPSLRRMNGSMLPVTVPKPTTPIRAPHTVSASQSARLHLARALPVSTDADHHDVRARAAVGERSGESAVLFALHAARDSHRVSRRLVVDGGTSTAGAVLQHPTRDTG